MEAKSKPKDDKPNGEDEKAAKVAEHNQEVIASLANLIELARNSEDYFSIACAFALAPEHGGKIISGPLCMTLASTCGVMAYELGNRPFEQGKEEQAAAQEKAQKAADLPEIILP